MKVSQLLEQQPLLASMLEKLLGKGYTVKIDAHGAPFKSGNKSDGHEWRRAHYRGAVAEYDGIWVDTLTYTIDDDFIYGQEKLPRFRGHMPLMFPTDKYYTIKKIDGMWTIVDKGEVKKIEPVAESKEHNEFMLKMAMKKMLAAKLDTHLKVTSRGTPYLMTMTPAFTINTYFDPEEPKGKWFCGWFPNATGSRAGPILHFDTVDEVIQDIKGE